MQARRGRCGAIARAATGLLAAALAAAAPCSAVAQQDARGYATQPFTPKDFKLPAGEGCAAEVARWKAVQDNDYASGNIGLKVYHHIQAEIARAEASCQSGRDGEARAMVHASKVRHGYPG